jgi:hypothetical protein
MASALAQAIAQAAGAAGQLTPGMIGLINMMTSNGAEGGSSSNSSGGNSSSGNNSGNSGNSYASGGAQVGRTLPNATRGWRVGDPINNLTAKGQVPSWSAVRQRIWKNEAFASAKNYSPENLARMQRGLAPQQLNPRTGRLESMELHHRPPQRAGGLFDVEKVWPSRHAEIDPFRQPGD